MGGNTSQETPFTITITEGDTQSQELFDYNSVFTHTQVSTLTFPSFLASNSEEVVYSQTHERIEKEALLPLYELTSSGYRLIKFRNVARNGDDKSVWKVIGNRETLVEQGDIIKIGKIKLEIKEIALTKPNDLGDRMDTERN